MGERHEVKAGLRRTPQFLMWTKHRRKGKGGGNSGREKVKKERRLENRAAGTGTAYIHRRRSRLNGEGDQSSRWREREEKEHLRKNTQNAGKLNTVPAFRGTKESPHRGGKYAPKYLGTRSEDKKRRLKKKIVHGRRSGGENHRMRSQILSADFH